MRGCVTDTGALYVVWRARYDCDRVERVTMGETVHFGRKEQKILHTWWPHWDSSTHFFHSQSPEGKRVKVSSGQTEEQHACFSWLVQEVAGKSNAGIYLGTRALQAWPGPDTRGEETSAQLPPCIVSRSPSAPKGEKNYRYRRGIL